MSLGPNKGVGQFFNMSWVTEYNWDDQILHETKSESKPKLEQKQLWQQQNHFFSANSEEFIQP